MTDRRQSRLLNNSYDKSVPQYAVDALRAVLRRSNSRLISQNSDFCCDEVLRIHLQQCVADPAERHAFMGNISSAETVLKETLQWREANVNGRDLKCPLCSKLKNAHCFFKVGQDSNRVPILYGCPARGQSNDVGLIVTHVVYQLERAIFRRKLKQDGLPLWILVLDLRGFKSKHVSVSLALRLANIVQFRYRGQLSRAVIIDSPQNFMIMHSAVLQTFSPDIERRISFTTSKQFRENQDFLRLPFEISAWFEAVLSSPVHTPLPVAPKVLSYSVEHPEPNPAGNDQDAAWERLKKRQLLSSVSGEQSLISKMEAPVLAIEEVEQTLFDISDDYGMPACDEDLRVASIKLISVHANPDNNAIRRRNMDYDESSDRSMAGSMEGVEGSPAFSDHSSSASSVADLKEVQGSVLSQVSSMTSQAFSMPSLTSIPSETRDTILTIDSNGDSTVLSSNDPEGGPTPVEELQALSAMDRMASRMKSSAPPPEPAPLLPQEPTALSPSSSHKQSRKPSQDPPPSFSVITETGTDPEIVETRRRLDDIQQLLTDLMDGNVDNLDINQILDASKRPSTQSKAVERSSEALDVDQVSSRSSQVVVPPPDNSMLLASHSLDDLPPYAERQKEEQAQEEDQPEETKPVRKLIANPSMKVTGNEPGYGIPPQQGANESLRDLEKYIRSDTIVLDVKEPDIAEEGDVFPVGDQEEEDQEGREMEHMESWRPDQEVTLREYVRWVNKCAGHTWGCGGIIFDKDKNGCLAGLSCLCRDLPTVLNVRVMCLLYSLYHPTMTNKLLSWTFACLIVLGVMMVAVEVKLDVFWGLNLGTVISIFIVLYAFLLDLVAGLMVLANQVFLHAGAALIRWQVSEYMVETAAVLTLAAATAQAVAHLGMKDYPVQFHSFSTWWIQIPGSPFWILWKFLAVIPAAVAEWLSAPRVLTISAMFALFEMGYHPAWLPEMTILHLVGDLYSIPGKRQHSGLERGKVTRAQSLGKPTHMLQVWEAVYGAHCDNVHVMLAENKRRRKSKLSSMGTMVHVKKRIPPEIVTLVPIKVWNDHDEPRPLLNILYSALAT